MIKIILNYVASAVAYIMAFYLFNLSMDEINFGSAYVKDIEPMFGIPAAMAMVACGLHFYWKADKLSDEHHNKEE